MGWQVDLVSRAAHEAEHEPGLAVLVLTGSVAGTSSAGVDAWADVDLWVLTDGRPPEHFDGGRWAARFGRSWARTTRSAAEGLVHRVVYDDGRRLDVVVTDQSSAVPAAPVLFHRAPTTAPGAERASDATAVPVPAAGVDEQLAQVRQAAALAVVKLARNDLLIGMHLAVGLVQGCLEQAMLLRDRRLGTTSHPTGGPFNDVADRLGRLVEHPWTATAGMDLVREVVRVHDDLAVQLDPTYAADWSGLEALLRQAGR